MLLYLAWLQGGRKGSRGLGPSTVEDLQGKEARSAGGCRRPQPAEGSRATQELAALARLEKPRLGLGERSRGSPQPVWASGWRLLIQTVHMEFFPRWVFKFGQKPSFLCPFKPHSLGT